MKTIKAHTLFQLLKLSRNPAFLAPTLIFPAMLYGFFGASLPPVGIYSQYAIASFCVYGVMGVSFYQFGVGIAQDRENPFDIWINTLPASSLPKGIAQIISAILFSIISVGLVIGLSMLLAKTALSSVMVVKLIAACIVVAVPASLMGIALGYFTSARAAPAVANLVFLPLAFLGGLWIPPIQMSNTINKISFWSPTRQMGEIAWSAIDGNYPQTSTIALLIAYSVLFAILSFVLIARDKNRRFV